MRLHAFLFCRRIIVASALLLVAVPAWAGDRPDQRATLRGVKAITVVVADVSADAERNGLTKGQLQTDTELRLRKAGIVVAPDTGVNLTIVVTTHRREEESFDAVSIGVYCVQWVTLLRDSSIAASAETWGLRTTGSAGRNNLRDARAEVDDLVDQFINAYLEQNPKP